MDVEEANKIAHAFLSEHIEIEQCADPPDGLYAFNRSKEFLFRFRLFGHSWMIGSSEYIAVSKETGAIRYLGFHGE